MHIARAIIAEDRINIFGEDSTVAKHHARAPSSRDKIPLTVFTMGRRDRTDTLCNVNCFPFAKQEFPFLAIRKNWVIFIIKSDSFLMAEKWMRYHTSSNSRQHNFERCNIISGFCSLFQKYGRYYRNNIFWRGGGGFGTSLQSFSSCPTRGTSFLFQNVFFFSPRGQLHFKTSSYGNASSYALQT